MDDKIFQQFTDDDIFRNFFEDSFDSKDYAARVIEAHAISQQLSKLAEGINLLDKELKNHVVNHHEDLLSQATGLETLEGVLQMMQSRSKSLLTAVERIRSRIIEPYNKISVRTIQLHQLQETCDILRHVIRAMYLSKRLQSQLLSGTKEITKAAQSLNELDHLTSSGVDLTGIDIIDADRKFIQQSRIDVETHGHKILQQGLDNQNQTQVGTALQIFFNLSCLVEMVSKTTNRIHKQLDDLISSSLDVNQLTIATNRKSGPGRISGLSNTANSASLRTAFWINIEKVFDSIYSSYSQILLLQKIIGRKKDPVTHTLFIDHLEQEKNEKVNLLNDYWVHILKYLQNSFNKTIQGNTVLKQALESEYLKLLRYFADLWRKLEASHATENFKNDQNTDLQPLPPIDFDLEKELRNTFVQFEVLYLSRSLSRLFDPVNLLFSTTNPSAPISDELDGVIRIINNELSAANFDEKLSISVAKNVNKTIVLFCSKSENILSTDVISNQVIGPPNQAQLLNASIINSLYSFGKALNKIVDNLSGFSEVGIIVLHDSLESLNVLIENSLESMFASISSAIDDILMTMQDEDFSQPLQDEKSKQEMAACSLYMKELQLFVARVANTYGPLYQCHDLVQQKFISIGCKCLNLFVRHSSLVCPLGEGGKLRLAADYAQMELAISPFCNKLSDFGIPYRLIRAIRPMLFQTAEVISQSAALVEIVPLSLILHFLTVRGYPALKPLHQSAGWTCGRYSQWLDEHPNERDRLIFIKGSLESYAQYVTNHGGKEFVSVYPVMLKLLQRGLQLQS